jgi:hypothetical protein
VMVGRSVPAVLTVRAFLRAAKTGVRRSVPALSGVGLALVGAVALARIGTSPVSVAWLFTLFATRSLTLLVWPRPALRARTLGMIETVLGLIFVLTTALTWRN